MVVLKYEIASQEERAEIRYQEDLDASAISKWRKGIIKSLELGHGSSSSSASSRSVRYTRADRMSRAPRHAKPNQHDEAQLFITVLARLLRWLD
ncbi:hypothetical protein ACFQVD_36140 [Streptosporangium amethystogenes subsp. fukuiense]|uniref:Transposase n=1 Tax=Streptosporangium amethystogenes subsp. fukuiense TaxID=698418 RepID=A0ABW2TBE8_9ACTN